MENRIVLLFCCKKFYLNSNFKKDVEQTILYEKELGKRFIVKTEIKDKKMYDDIIEDGNIPKLNILDLKAFEHFYVLLNEETYDNVNIKQMFSSKNEFNKVKITNNPFLDVYGDVMCLTFSCKCSEGKMECNMGLINNETNEKICISKVDCRDLLFHTDYSKKI